MAVTLYGKETCCKCTIAKKKLEQAGIAFEFRDDEDEIIRLFPDQTIPILACEEHPEGMSFSEMCKWIKEHKS